MKKMVPGKDRPYKSDELFQIIMDQLKEKNLLPDILDYGHTERTHTSDMQSSTRRRITTLFFRTRPLRMPWSRSANIMTTS